MLDEAAASLDLFRTQAGQSTGQATEAGSNPVAEGVELAAVGDPDPPSIDPPRNELVAVDTPTPDHKQLVDDILAQSSMVRTIEAEACAQLTGAGVAATAIQQVTIFSVVIGIWSARPVLSKRMSPSVRR